MDNMEFVDISESDDVKKKDYFMIGIYIAIAILIITGSLIYFFGYDFFKQFIKV